MKEEEERGMERKRERRYNKTQLTFGKPRDV